VLFFRHPERAPATLVTRDLPRRRHAPARPTAAAGLSALEHFVAWGAAEGRTGIVLDDGLLVA
jgi:hypothetical protein